MKFQIICLLAMIRTEVIMRVHPSLCGAAAYLVDTRCSELRNEESAIDTFYDRIVALIYFNPNRNIRSPAVGSGVFITRHLILSSFNAYQTLAHRNDTIKNMRALVIYGRRFRADGTFSYRIVNYGKTRIICGRQVLMRNKLEPLADHMRHGIHCPLHDLMVLRLSEPVNFTVPMPPRRYTFRDYQSMGTWNEVWQSYDWETGTIRTKVARPGDQLSDDIKWASMGHIDDEHIYLYRFAEIGKVTLGEKVIADCDAWIPREWGRFICLFNNNNYPGLASGGVLFSEDLLFGIGSFALFKGKDSVLVFTDVRPYWHLLYRTCTVKDQRLEIPEK